MTAGEGVTEILRSWSRGEEPAFDRLIERVAGELRAMAGRFLKDERPDHTLQPTALVNELCLRLMGRQRVAWQSRAQFFAFAAETMRFILVDHARGRRRAKRGAGWTRVGFDSASSLVIGPEEEILALDEALGDLAALDPRLGRIVELRFFAGLTLDEVAELMGLSATTVSRGWASARAWLYRELSRRPARAACEE